MIERVAAEPPPKEEHCSLGSTTSANASDPEIDELVYELCGITDEGRTHRRVASPASTKEEGPAVTVCDYSGSSAKSSARRGNPLAGLGVFTVFTSTKRKSIGGR